MKKYRFEFTLRDGNDEFWESDPTYREVIKLVRDELNRIDLKITDLTLVGLQEELRMTESSDDYEH